jgi:transcriptional regulator with XRE-family HTH domain
VEGFYEQFGSRVRKARRHIGMSQEELGYLVGLNRSSISNVELGRQRVALHMLMQFATALAVEPADLLPGDPPPRDPLRGVPQEARAFVEGVLSTASEVSNV